MKKNKKVIILLFSLLLAFTSFAIMGCKVENVKNKKGAEVAVAMIDFDKRLPSDIVFQININDAKFNKLTKGENEVNKENYVFASGIFTIKKEFCSGLDAGKNDFVFVTDVNSLTLSVNVFVSVAPPPSEEELMNDPYFNVDQNGNNTIIEPTDADWSSLKNKRKPLNYGESFTETFGNSFSSSYLLPYKNELFSPNHSEYMANFRIIDDSTKKAVQMYGYESGEFYSNQSWAHIAFRGIRFTEKAEYKVDITYMPRTENSKFQLCFSNPQNAIANLSGSKDVACTTSAKFVADTNNGYNGNTAAYLIVSFGGGKTSDQIDINQIKITRLKKAPEISGISFSGNIDDGFIKAGEYNVSYISDSPNGEMITWFTASNTSDTKNLSLIKEVRSTDVNAKSITVDESMKGKFIGVYIYPNVDENEYQISSVQAVFSEQKVIANVDYKKINLTMANATFTETFDDTATAENIDYSSTGANVYSATAPMGMEGQSLFVECDNSSQYQGVTFDNFDLLENGVYQVKFKVLFVDTVMDSWYMKFRPGDAYWDDIEISFDLSGKQANTVYEYVSEPIKLSDKQGYKLLMHNYSKEGTVILEDLTVAKIEPKALNNVGDKALLDFDNNFDFFVNDNNKDLASTISKVDGTSFGLDQKVLKVVPNTSTVVGFSMAGMELKSNSYYQIKFDMYIDLEGDLGGQFLTKFMSGDEVAVQDMKYSSSLKKKEKFAVKSPKIKVDENKNITRIDLLNYYASFTFYVDNLSIEIVPAPDSNNTLTQLTKVGDKVSDNFEGDKRNIAFSGPMSEKIVDKNSISNFSNAVQIDFDGSIGYNFVDFTNFSIPAGASIKINFDYIVTKGDSVKEYATVYLREGVTYANVTKALWVGSVSTVVQKFEATLTITGERTDWIMQLGNNNEPINACIILDNLSLELAAPPTPPIEEVYAVNIDFESILESDYQANGESTITIENGFDGKGLRYFSPNTLAGKYPGYFLKNLKLPKSSKIEVSFDYKATTADSYYGFQFNGWDYVAINKDINNNNLAIYAKKDTKGSYKATILLGDRDDYMFCMNTYGNENRDIIIDNLKIKIVK